MLSQDELDKLLAEGLDDQGEKKEEPQEAGGDQPQEGAESDSQASQEGQPAAEEAAGGDDDLDWEAAFQEAAAGGDPAAAKQLQEGTVNPEPEEEPGPDIAAAEAQFSDFGKEKAKAHEGAAKPDLDFILDIPLQVSVELGRARLQIRDLLQLGRGSVIELNKMAGEPAEIYVNNKLMAKGEVVVVNEKFGVRLTEIISPADRVRSLG